MHRIMKVDLPSGEAMTKRIFNVNNIERTWVSLPRSDHTNTTQVVATSDEAKVASFEFEEI